MSVTVGVRELRENLRAYLVRVKAGEEVVVTERGKPVAKLVAPRSRFDELVAAGVVTPARRPRTDWRRFEPLPARGSVSELIVRDRRGRWGRTSTRRRSSRR